MKTNIIFSCLVFFFTLSTSFAQTNLALGKKATQSSNHNSNLGRAAVAVDGNKNGSWSNKSVTHTASEANPWWEVDLGATYNISTVKIYNRTDCCSERIKGAQIYVSTVTRRGIHFGTITEPSATIVKTGNATGRYIRVYIPSSSAILSIAEVEVYGTKDASSTSNVIRNAKGNLAKGKKATQSSTYNNQGQARVAVDGNTNGAWSNKSVTHTKTEANPWLEVDLGATYDISTIRIYNRTDCCQERIDGVEIYVKQKASDKGKYFGSINYRKGMSSSITKNGSAIGRYIRLLKRNTNTPLSIAELEVYSVPPPKKILPYTVTIRSEALYVARCTLSYIIPGYLEAHVADFTFTAGQSKSFDIPAEATKIKIKGEGATGLIWKPWNTTIDKTYPAESMCIKFYGTTLHQKYNRNCIE